MNKRQKKKQLKMRNKQLVKQHPYLLPRSVWTGKVVNGYDYTWTDYDCIDKGWRIGFGKFLLEDLREALVKTNYLDKFRFSQIKEKYGRLCLYNFGAPQEVHDVIHRYEWLSQYVCWYCGSPEATVVDDYGWYLPVCKECWQKHNSERATKGYMIKAWDVVADLDDVGLPSEYKYTTYSNGVDTVVTVDISETANKIWDAYGKRLRKKENRIIQTLKDRGMYHEGDDGSVSIF